MRPYIEFKNVVKQFGTLRHWIMCLLRSQRVLL